MAGYTASSILMAKGMILEWYFNIINRIFGDSGRKEGDFRCAWLFKPLGGCYECLSGQIALWTYLFMATPYSFAEHIIVICMAIYSANIFSKFDLWLKN